MVYPRAMWKNSSKSNLRTLLKQKKLKKTQMIQMIGLIRPMLIKIWNCIRRNHFLEPNIRSPWIHFQLGWSANIFNFSVVSIKFQLLMPFFFQFFPHEVIFQVNATSKESCFNMPTCYISFYYCQLNQCGSY